MMVLERPRIAIVALAASMALSVGVAHAQDVARDLDEFIHNVNVARPELAEGFAQRVLDSGVSNADLARIVDEDPDRRDRLMAAFTRARVMFDLRDITAALESRIEGGRMDLARDTTRIEEAIAMLDGTLRQRSMAEARLLEAGEYAVPVLLNEIISGDNPTIRQRCVETLVRIGRVAVYPLAAALPSLDAQAQTRVCDILGRIGYSHAAPSLYSLSQNASASAATREAAARAFRRVGGADSTQTVLYTELGRRYFQGEQSLIAYANEATNNIWSYDSFNGLTMTPVPTSIFTQVRAMQLSRRALQLSPDSTPALSLFIASNLRRQNELGEDETDPIFGSSNYTPAFYAMAAGPSVIQNVLAMALDIEDTALVRDAITALSGTAGSDMLAMDDGRQPLLEALQYPDRRVRYEAALALGKSLPSQAFAGDYTVIPLLASAIRAGDETYALVLADNPEDRQQLGNWMANLGYQVVVAAGNIHEAESSIARSAGIDVVVAKQSPRNVSESIGVLRTNPRAAVAPVLIVTSGTDLPAIEDEFGQDRRVVVRVATIDQAAFGRSLDNAINRASGSRISEMEAQIYAIEALATLRDLAISGHAVFNVLDAESALIDALAARQDGTGVLVAEVLCRLDSPRSQRAVFDAALAASGHEQIELLNRLALSARRFGNLSEERHINGLLRLVTAGEAVGEAAARVHGALNLPAANAVRLIAN